MENPSQDLAEAFLGEQFHLSVPSHLDWIGPTVDLLTNRAVQCGAVGATRSMRIMMALHEALTNAIVHGNLEISSGLKEEGDQAFAQALAARCSDPRYAERKVDVVVRYDGGRITWVLSDQGPGFDVDRMLQRLDNDTNPNVSPSGRGILMMRAFLDEVRWEAGGRRVVLALDRASGSEKRSQTRHPFQQTVQVAPIDPAGSVDWEHAAPALSRNISSDGIALLQNHLASTERVLITLASEGQTISLPAEVRHWQQVGDHAVEVGCRFESSPLPTPEQPAPGLEALILRLEQQLQEVQERRSAPRVPYTAAIQIEHPQKAGPLRGFSRDLSRGGLSFLTTESLPPGGVVLAIPQEGDLPPLRVRATVLRCTHLVEGFYDVAARFSGAG